MGPIVLLDKSTFQSLASRELTTLRCHFIENLTPILMMELLGDLSKQVKKGASPERKVAELARKFGGSGPAVNADYRKACLKVLADGSISLTGQIVVDYGRKVPSEDGSYGIVIDLHPFNEAIMRWSEGDFADWEKVASGVWREATRNLSYSSFESELNSRRVIVPKAESLEDLPRIVDGLASSVGLQDVWIDWLVGQLNPPSHLAKRIGGRWRYRDRALLRDFSPYAYHCVRALLALHVAVRSRLIRWNATHLLDLQYLYYLPFCMVFASDDKLHHSLAPMLLRSDQSFVEGRALKKDLRRIMEFWDRLDEKGVKRWAFALGSHPPPAAGSLVCDLWSRHCRPWTPESYNRATELSEDECAEAIREAAALFASVRTS